MPNGHGPTGFDLALSNSGDLEKLKERVVKLEAEVVDLRSRLHRITVWAEGVASSLQGRIIAP